MERNEINAKLKKLKGELQGYYGIVADEAKVAVSTVSRVLDGKIINEDVLAKCIEVRDRELLAKQLRTEKLYSRI